MMRKQAVWTWLVAAGLVLGVNGGAVAGPVVGGWEYLERSGEVGDVELGRLLLGELSCVSCHAVDEGAGGRKRGAPDLGEIGARVTPGWLREYLSNPAEVKAGTTMPHVLGELEGEELPEAVEALTHFLVEQGGPIAESQTAASEAQVEAGRRLYHRLGCAACHAVEGVDQTEITSVPLEGLGRKTTVEALSAFLRDPHAARPEGRMPSFELSGDEARRIAIYLLRDQAEEAFAREPVRRSGIDYAYYEARMPQHLPEFDALGEPTRAGAMDQFSIDLEGRRDDHFAFLFTGLIEIEQTGEWTFSTVSDDGSKLLINGELVVDNDGLHAAQERSGTIELDEGVHEIVVEYFEFEGQNELTVYWSGPGVEREEIPADVLYRMGTQPLRPLNHEPLAEVDAGLASRGRELFASMGCASCHDLDGVASTYDAPRLAELFNPEAGCLSEDAVARPADYALSDRQLSVLRAAVGEVEQVIEPLSPEREVVHTLAAMNCYACHQRDGVGGPEAARAEVFETLSPVDMGEEGRLPPPLDDAGAKLRPEALERILFDGELHVRPHMATRMPLYGRENLAGLIGFLTEVDEVDAGWGDPAFSDDAVEAGHRIAGVTGLSCITCHTAAGYESLGIPGVDLTVMHERLQVDWFRQFMQDPAVVREGTRMPAFWQDGLVIHPDIADGTVQGQIDALWAYLSLGGSMPLPQGLDVSAGDQYVLTPVEEPIVHRTFMEQVGPRAIAVGYPERVHVAFDANQVRLAQAWRGDFFSARGMWEGRGGALLGPLGQDEIDFPAGPAVAKLDSEEERWPRGEQHARNVGGQFVGYLLDGDRRPMFRYRLGQVTVTEQPLPVLRPGGTGLVRRFDFSGVPDQTTVYVLALRGRAIEEEGEGVYRDEAGRRVRVAAGREGSVAAVVREVDGADETEVLVPVELTPGESRRIELEMTW